MVAACTVALLLSTLVLGKSTTRSLQVHERRDEAPNGFTLNGAANADHTLSLRIGLAQNNLVGLYDALNDVSDPSSDKYGQHLSKEEVEAFVAPTSESTEAVTAWLNEHGLNATAVSPAGDWLAVNVSVAQANSLLLADYSLFTHDSTGADTIRTLQYSLPTDLQAHIGCVHPTTTFPSIINHSPILESWTRREDTGEVEARAVTPCGSGNPNMIPECLQAMYGIPTTPATQSSNQIAVTGYDGIYAEEADLQSFLTTYRPDVSNSTTYTVISVNNGTDPQWRENAGTEANLDVEYAVGLATNVPAFFMTVGGSFDDALLDAANYLLSMDNPPQVVSTSYGDNENVLSENLANSICNAYAQLGARGVSILYASGDGGVSGNQASDNCTEFVPVFPASCPYVTTIGATTSQPTEVAASFSGGGFSNYFGQPAYQSDAVASYLSALGSNSSGLFNASGRAYPDVSAYGTRYDIKSGSATLIVSGTSCSTPTFAAIIALLNDQLLGAGKSVLGFLNPWLYSTASGMGALNDIVDGNNLACSGGTTGFYAAQGWDPVTGLGTPNFTLLASAAGL
ncbi:family S53 protease [Fomitopsis serialis]|uniref:family S53 protease n=1 Tax=Fomitopsis serialis TaxID=139415 RepID=UPI002007A13A|nr:family S53 protease [Neoantrodia serialis]KAH9913511.1 family S53 protease [Neoantrodia serialis]